MPCFLQFRIAPQFFTGFLTLISLKFTDQLFCRMSLFGLWNVSSWLENKIMHLWQGYHRNDVIFFSWHSIKSVMWFLFVPLLLMINFDHLLKMTSASFSIVKLHIIPFWLIMVRIGVKSIGTVKLCKYYIHIPYQSFS